MSDVWWCRKHQQMDGECGVFGWHEVEPIQIETMNEPPVRLCCFQRHHGAICPDGLVQCCLCFRRFDISDLNETPDGPEDVCKRCALAEAAGEVRP